MKDRPAPAETVLAPPHALVLFNPVAPRADLAALRPMLDQVFGAREGRFDVLQIPAENASAAVDEALASAIDAGCNLVLAAGGDGTVSLAVNRVAHSEKRDLLVGIVPLGTTNLLARELKIPLDPELAVAVAAERRRVIELDGMEARGHLYLTQVGIGLDARMIGETKREEQIRHGRAAYFMTFMRNVIGYGSHRVTIDFGGRRLRTRAWQVVVANAATIGMPPFTWGPDVDPADGVLDLCIYDVRGIGGTLAILWRVLTGRHQHDPNTRFHRIEDAVAIRSARPLPVQGDGELIGRTPITVQRVRCAARIVVPETVPDAVRELEVPPEDRPAEMPRIAQHVLVHRIGTLRAIDAALFLRFNSLEGGPMIDRLMMGASRLMNHGEAWLLAALIAWLAVPGREPATLLRLIAALWLTMLTVNYPVKAIFRRRRPFVAYVKTRVIGRRPTDSSFPSGHTAAAFAGALLLEPYMPIFAPLLFLYALVVAFSRVYLGVHYPSDVAMGAFAGSVLAVIWRWILGV